MANIKKNSDSCSLPTTTKQIFVWQQHVFVVLFIDNNTDCFALQACRQYHSLPMTKVTTNKMFWHTFCDINSPALELDS